ncbi:MAG: carboxypeptidase-like regulatory domain-containing protein [Bacteroidales bacterium]|nr:carboxypeptidase-like regulatory domain-containing protein [Bacteroidales bacterium]MDD2425628.1 carboxypeptidase-like regulatory domain-containing protein [Bacteroidales bacterium]MDD3989744.1 carboxypeptidase-like regulatory domain-containing protein [Bacteroidales bacterium]
MKKIIGFVLFLTMGCMVCFAASQTITITGKVTDPDGNTIEKVSVTLKNEVYGTATDRAGCYAFIAPAESKILVFSAKGYLPKEEVIGGRTVINMQLERDPNAATQSSKAKKPDKQRKSRKPRR